MESLVAGPVVCPSQWIGR